MNNEYSYLMIDSVYNLRYTIKKRYAIRLCRKYAHIVLMYYVLNQ